MPIAAAIPPEIAALSKRQQRTFESDFLREAASKPSVRKAGRSYFALGWRAHYDAVSGHGRRRKATGECRILGCRCVYHVATEPTNGKVDADRVLAMVTEALRDVGLEGSPRLRAAIAAAVRGAGELELAHA